MQSNGGGETVRADRQTVKLARTLRRPMSPPEFALWVRLRARGAGKQVWRRQHPLGAYVLDFYCHAARLVVEVDGISHGMGDRATHDERRDNWLRAQGLRVLRIAASDVLADPDNVADGLGRLANAMLTSLRGRCPEGGGGSRHHLSNAHLTPRTPSDGCAATSPAARERGVRRERAAQALVGGFGALVGG